MPRRKQPDGFIGYVRVSTERQGYEGNSLRAQTLQLEEYVRGTGKKLEVVPGVEPGHGPIAGRPRFMEAIKKAKERGWKLLVINPSRLSRDVDHLKYIDFRKTPVWIFGEGPISKERLIEAVRRAARELKQLRIDGAAGAPARDPGFKTEEAKQNAEEGRRKGGEKNADRAHRNLIRVQDYIEKHDGAEKLGDQELADALNSAGIMNRVKETPITDKLWTVGSLRPVRKNAIERIALDEELMEEDLVGATDKTPSEVMGVASGPQLDSPSGDCEESKSTASGWLRRAARWVKKTLRSVISKI